MPYEPVREDPYEVAAAARGEGNGTWSQREALYMMQRVPVLAEFRIMYWAIWAWLAATCAAASIASICIVLLRPKLRAQPYNHYIVGLSIPDLAYSGLCVFTCALHAAAGHWYDGEGVGNGRWMCDFQAAYLTFGMAGSLWVNVAVTNELDGLTTAMRLMQQRSTPSIAKVYRRIGAALALALAIAWVTVYGHLAIPSLPSRAYPVRDLACIPVATNDAEQLFMHAFTLPVMIWTPLALIFGAGVRVLRNFYLSGASMMPPLPRVLRQPWAWRSADAPLPAAATSGAAPHVSAGADVHGMVRDASTRVIVEFFSRLLFVIILMWLPYLIGCFLVVLPTHESGSHIYFVSGAYSHLQGIVSTVMYFLKADVRAEVAQIGAELRAALGCARGASVHPRAGGGADDSESSRSLAGPRAERAALLRGERRAESASASSRDDEQFSEWVAATKLAASQLSHGSSRGQRRASGSGRVAPDAAAAAVATAAAAGSAADDSSARARAPGGRVRHRESKASAQLREAREAQALRELSAEAIAQILALEQTPMLVVDWAAFAAHGRIPISGERLARARVEGDVVVFISHRWWGDKTPDTAAHPKFELVCAGLRRIISKHGLAAERVALWIDYACISQEDAGLMVQGIASLLTYAARSSFVLIPVAPTVEAASALERALHPFDLVDWGARAWCRLEAYIFLCLSHITQRPAFVYAYTDTAVADATARAGARRVERPAPSAAAAPSDRAQLGGHAVAAPPSPTGERGRASERAAERARALLRAAAGALRERLAPARRRRVLFRQLQRTDGAGQGGAIRFTRSQLPSSGELTVETDRAIIREIEGIVRERFVRHAILSARLRQSSSLGHGREFALDFKQIDGPQLPLLAAALHAEAAAPIGTLSLRGNLFGGDDARALVDALVRARAVVALAELRLGGNVHLGFAGVRALGAMLAQPSCQLRALALDGCALSPTCGHELSAALEHNRSLRALDVRHNELDDDAVLALMAARATMQARGLYLDLSVDGNPISAATYRLVALTHYSDAARRQPGGGPTPT